MSDVKPPNDANGDEIPLDTEYLLDAASSRPTCEREPCGRSVWRCSRCGAFVRRGSVMDCCGAIPERYCPNGGAMVIA